MVPPGRTSLHITPSVVVGHVYLAAQPCVKPPPQSHSSSTNSGATTMTLTPSVTTPPVTTTPQPAQPSPSTQTGTAQMTPPSAITASSGVQPAQPSPSTQTGTAQTTPPSATAASSGVQPASQSQWTTPVLTEEQRTMSVCDTAIECLMKPREVVCPADKPFAMNTLDQPGDGSRTLTKQCASVDECHDRWYKGTSDVSECMNAFSEYATDIQMTCHWCCTGYKCNPKGLKPADKDLYVDDAWWK